MDTDRGGSTLTARPSGAPTDALTEAASNAPAVTPAGAPSKRATVRRKADRGRYDRDSINAILDEALVAHVGVVTERGPLVIPMAYARIDSFLYLHGATGNAMLKAAFDEHDICITVTLLDGLVLSRSSFHHSVNYRSVVLFGRASRVDDGDEKRRAVLAVVDHMVPGRATDCRPPTDAELRATAVLRVPITEASAKVRAGGPIEEPDDLPLPYWAGVMPVTTTIAAAVPDAHVPFSIGVPPYVREYRRPTATVK